MERPDTAALLEEVEALVRRYVVLPTDRFYVAVALWVLHAHAIEAAETTPRLLIKSAEKESGKTRLLEVLEMLAPNPLSTLNCTVAALFRSLKEKQATLLFDEADTFFGPAADPRNEDLRAAINGGYHRGAVVLRVVGIGTKQNVVAFPVFAACAVAAIGNLPETIESRSITIPMRRRAPDEEVASFRRRWALLESSNLRDSLIEWASVYVPDLKEAEPAMPAGIADRAADIWEPLLAISDLAGGDWPTRAREAATAIVSGRVAEDQSLGVRLLSDIQVVLNGDDRMSSVALAGALCSIEESGWAGWNAGKGIGPHDLARRLKGYGIQPRVIRVGDETPRGYHREQFVDSWRRYLRVDERPAKPEKARDDANGGLLDDVCEAFPE